MALLSQVPIAIIGAGPSGLTLARLLELAHINYIVFERDESATWADEYSSSGTLDIHKDSGQLALKEAGLIEEFQSISRYDVPTRTVDAQGRVHANLSGDGVQDKPEIDRKDLRRLLLRSIPTGRVRWDYKVQRVQKEIDSLVSVYSANGHCESGFRLVVGADGAWSKVRKLVTSIEPQYSGTHFFTSFIQPDNPLYPSVTSKVEKGNYLALGKGRQIFLHCLGDGSYHLAVGVKLPENWSSDSAVDHDPSALWQSLLQNEFAEWTPELTDLIKWSDRSFRSWPLYTLPEDFVPWKHTPGVTLLGDAAHLTIPAGEGVNNALCDSLELAKQIIKHGLDNLDSAVVDYEKVILPRAVGAMKKANFATRYIFGAQSPQTFLQAVGVPSEIE